MDTTVQWLLHADMYLALALLGGFLLFCCIVIIRWIANVVRP